MGKTKAEKWEYNERDIMAQVAAAERRAEAADRTQPRASAVHYDRNQRRIVVELTKGSPLRLAPDKLQGLEQASPDELADVKVAPGGAALHWRKLNVGFTVPGLAAGVFGSPSWMSTLNRDDGEVVSRPRPNKPVRPGAPKGRSQKSPTR